MKILVDSLTLLALGAWPLFLMWMPLLFRTEGVALDRGSLVFFAAVLLYPVALMGFYLAVGAPFFGLRPRLCFWSIALAALGVALLFRFPAALVNHARGITGTGFSITADAVYFQGKRVAAADPRSFVLLQEGLYGKDAKHVYVDGGVLKGADPATFQPVACAGGDSYMRDARRVYWFGTVLPKSNPHAFQVLLHGYARDDVRVYYHAEPIADADPKSFVVLSAAVAKDARRVFSEDQRILLMVHASSFGLVGEKGYYAKDRRQVYYGGVDWIDSSPIPGADPATFQVLDDEHARDKHHVYLADIEENRIEVLSGVDPNTFTVPREDAV